MKIQTLASALVAAALASCPCLAQVVGPTFSVVVQPSTGNPVVIQDIASLVLKQVVNPASQSVTPGGIQQLALQKIPPFIYTLTLTKYGDDSALCGQLTPGDPNNPVSLLVTFQGLKPDSTGNTSYSVNLNNLQRVRCLTQPGMLDEDFDSIDDIGMEKITMTFTDADIKAMGSTALSGVTGTTVPTPAVPTTTIPAPTVPTPTVPGAVSAS